MWEYTQRILDNGRVHRYQVQYAGKPMSYRAAVEQWQDDEDFRSFSISILKANPHQAYRWETPAMTTDLADRPFEFVLVNSPGLDQPADATSFAAQFAKAPPRSQVVTFPNLGRDSILVVPCPVGADANYAHLAAFVRSAPSSQVHDLWKSVGTAMLHRLGNSPVWLSTAGMGVSWLHVRLDSRPKYYAFAPYAKLEAGQR